MNKFQELNLTTVCAARFMSQSPMPMKTCKPWKNSRATIGNALCFKNGQCPCSKKFGGAQILETVLFVVFFPPGFFSSARSNQRLPSFWGHGGRQVANHKITPNMCTLEKIPNECQMRMLCDPPMCSTARCQLQFWRLCSENFRKMSSRDPRYATNVVVSELEMKSCCCPTTEQTV